MIVEGMKRRNGTHLILSKSISWRMSYTRYMAALMLALSSHMVSASHIYHLQMQPGAPAQTQQKEYSNKKRPVWWRLALLKRFQIQRHTAASSSSVSFRSSHKIPRFGQCVV